MSPEDKSVSSVPVDNSWFNAELGPAPTPPPRRPSWRRPLLIGLVTLLVIGVVTVIVIAATSATSTCLTKADYKDLTGIQYADTLSPTINFYSTSIGFGDGSATYDSPSATSTIEKLAAFYKSHSGKSILFTVNTSYQKDSDLALSETRIDTVARDLIKAGVSTEIVTQGIPYLITPEEPEISISIDNTVSVSLVSSESCKL